MSQLIAIVLLLLSPMAVLAQPVVTRSVLPNGLVVLAREDPAVGVVAASLQVRAGSLFETPQTAGITNLLQRVLVRGTQRRSALGLAQAAQELGGTLEASGDVEYAELRGAAIARQWEPLLALMAEVATEPTLPEIEVERARTLIVAQLGTRADTPLPFAIDTILRDLYGTHPYAWPALGRRDTVTHLTREQLLEHYRQIYRADRMVLAVSGNAPRVAVLAAAGRLFGRLPAGGGRPAVPATLVSPRGEPREVDREARQAQVLVAFPAVRLTDPDYAALRVLGTVLGGGMSSRLFVELRDRRGLAYSVGVVTPARTAPGPFIAYLGTAPANASEALAGVLAEVHRLREQPVEDRELSRAKAYVIGLQAMERQSSARHAFHLGFDELVAGGGDWPQRYARAVREVTAADVQRVASVYLVRPTAVVLRPPAEGRR